MITFEPTPKSHFFCRIATMIKLSFLSLDPFPPAPFPKNGKGRRALIDHIAVNHGIMMIRIPLPSLIGEGLGEG